MAQANEAERRRWNDARWAALWPKRERLTDMVTPVLLDALALRPGDRVLDVGCGGGRDALAAAWIVGAEGIVVGADISEPLTRLAQARATDEGVTNAEFVVADAQNEPIPGAPFDVAFSQFGVMFFDEPVKAFTNIAQQLAPGGRIGFACWRALDENPWFFAVAVADLLPPPPALAQGKSPTGPASLADVDSTTGILEAAGFVDVRCTPKELVVEVPEHAVVDEAQLEFMGVGAEKMPEARAAVDRHMARFRLSAELSRFPLAFQIFEARRP